MSKFEIAKRQVELAKPEFEANTTEFNLGLNFQKEASFALQIFQSNDYLSGMEANSIKNAIVNISLTGLTLNPVMKMAYLVPRKGKCVLDISYIGLVKILTDTGSIKNLEAHPIFANEPHKISRGTNPDVEHGLAPTGDKGEMIGVYSVATLNDGSKSVEWMYKADIDDIMKRSEAVKAQKGSPWVTDYTEMARKTVVKRHYKYLPKSERAILAATAIDIDHENNGINFNNEKKLKDTKSMNIEMFNNDVQDNIAEFESFMEKMNDETVPNSFKSKSGKEVNVRGMIDGLKDDFENNSLHLEKWNKTRDYLNQVYEAYKNKK